MVDIFNYPFNFFCYNLIIKFPSFNERYFNNWFKFNQLIFEESKNEKIIKINKDSRNIGFSTFMAFYLVFFCLKNKGSEVIVIDKNFFYSLCYEQLKYFEIFFVDEIIERLKSNSNKIIFVNGSKISFQSAQSYNIKFKKKVNLVYFEEVFIKNESKLRSDLINGLGTVEKLILTIPNEINIDKKIKNINI